MNARTRAPFIGVVAIAGLLLAGCTTASGSDDSGSGSGDDSLAALVATLEAASAPIDEFVAPGPAVDATQITGGTVYVVVPALEVADFSAVADTVKTVFAQLGVDTQACGTFGGSPDGVANCLQQAIDANAIGIVTVGITSNTSPTALGAVADAGIPVVNALTTATGDGDPSLVSYLAPDFIGMHAWLAAWAAVDADGAANLLALKSTDTDITPLWVEEGVVDSLAESCPDCTTEVIDVNVPNADKIATQVTTALVSNGDIDYVIGGTNNFVPDVITGAQAAGRTPTDTYVGTVGGSLAAMEQLAQGHWVSSVAGFSLPALGWYSSDLLIRLIVGEPVSGEVDFPFERLFTAENVADLDLTQDAWNDSSWYGDADYEAGFRALWGLE